MAAFRGPERSSWAAQGNAFKYVYVCFSRHRYGTQECDQDRLRADELEDRVVESLLATLADVTSSKEPSSVERDRGGNRPDREQELVAVEARNPQGPGVAGPLRRGVPGPAELAEPIRDIERALRDGAPPERKAVMQAVVAEMRVRDRGHVEPVFRMSFLGPPYGLMHMGWCPRQESNLRHTV